MISVLITGHRGFIGRHLWRHMEKCGAKLIGLDIKDDILNDICTAPLPEVDYCYHLAAQTNARSDDVVDNAQVNIMGSLRIFEKYRNHCCFASSSAVNYPVTPYAISKRTCEDYARLLDVRTVRFCNIYGEGGHGVFQRFADEEVLEIAGNGEQLRGCAPVNDAIYAVLMARDSLSILGGIELTVNQIADKLKHKPRLYVRKHPHDIYDGRQL